jgi:hypothetical protein
MLPGLRLDSVCVTDFPAVFAAFCGKTLRLLWSWSGDGFRAADIHGLYDSRPNAVAMIENTSGNVFGGWQPRRDKRSDLTKKTFLCPEESACFACDEIPADRK